jgi:uncharacterized protein (UPF0147 family)
LKNRCQQQQSETEELIGAVTEISVIEESSSDEKVSEPVVSEVEEPLQQQQSETEELIGAVTEISVIEESSSDEKVSEPANTDAGEVAAVKVSNEKSSSKSKNKK